MIKDNNDHSVTSTTTTSMETPLADSPSQKKATIQVVGKILDDDDDDIDSEELLEPPSFHEQTTAECSTFSERLGSSIRSAVEKHYSTLFGDEYSEKEGTFVLIAGILMAFNSGFVNASCLSGLLTGGVAACVTGYTAPYSQSALAFAEANWEAMSFPSGLILSYILGTFVAGIFTPRAKSYRIEPTYGPTFLVGGMFLLLASVLAAMEGDPHYVFCLVSASNGIQNGVSSIYSANLIRCTLTGATTDLTLAIAQTLRGNSKNLTKACVLSSLVISFWVGGIISFYLTSRWLSKTLFFNAALFWLIGAALVGFLVQQIGISVQAAILGTWHWKQVLYKLSQSDRFGIASLDTDDATQSALFGLFDEIDENKDGFLQHDELFHALLKADVNVTPNMVKMLMQSADENNDGLISREEWDALLRRMNKASRKTSPKSEKRKVSQHRVMAQA